MGGTSLSLAGLAAPPQIFINSPNNQSQTFAKEISLHGSALAIGKGVAIETMKVEVNGKPLTLVPVEVDTNFGRPDVLSKRKTDNKLLISGTISLKPGANKIVISCLDSNNQPAKQTVHVERKAKLGNIYAVVIGISSFGNASYNLQYAASDAQKFYNFLRSEAGGSIPAKRIKFLRNEQANRPAIVDALANFLRQAGPDDTVEIYLATHGVVDSDGSLFYLAHNTDLANLAGTGFSNDDLEMYVQKNIRAGKVIIYLDACHSGSTGLRSFTPAKGALASLKQTRALTAWPPTQQEQSWRHHLFCLQLRGRVK